MWCSLQAMTSTFTACKYILLSIINDWWLKLYCILLNFHLHAFQDEASIYFCSWLICPLHPIQRDNAYTTPYWKHLYNTYNTITFVRKTLHSQLISKCSVWLHTLRKRSTCSQNNNFESKKMPNNFINMVWLVSETFSQYKQTDRHSFNGVFSTTAWVSKQQKD